MTKVINYDFAVDTLITVEAPAGTDPDTLEQEVLGKLSAQVARGQVELVYNHTFDAETGTYSKEWEVKDEP